MADFVRNCRLCGESMESSPFMMCPICLKDSEQIRNFIVKNPHVSVEDISQATDVPFVKVEKMVSLGLNRKTDSEPEVL